jgi:two-component system, HptB-dependent secretion and biofilm response regulator
VPQELCNKTYAVVTELFLNALEHGVLQLDSEVKQQEDGFFRYYEMKDQALTHLSDKDFVTISLRWQAALAQLTLCISDSGMGFTPQQNKLGVSDVPHGRGLHLITQLSESVQISGNGNQFEVVLRG